MLYDAHINNTLQNWVREMLHSKKYLLDERDQVLRSMTVSVENIIVHKEMVLIVWYIYT